MNLVNSHFSIVKQILLQSLEKYWTIVWNCDLRKIMRIEPKSTIWKENFMIFLRKNVAWNYTNCISICKVVQCALKLLQWFGNYLIMYASLLCSLDEQGNKNLHTFKGNYAYLNRVSFLIKAILFWEFQQYVIKWNPDLYACKYASRLLRGSVKISKAHVSICST